MEEPQFRPSLHEIAEDFRSSPGVLRKRPIGTVFDVIGKSVPLIRSRLDTDSAESVETPIIKGIPSNYVPVADLGEDAAVFLPGKDRSSHDEGEEKTGYALLLAADGIMQELIDSDPFWAGYCSIMVNAHDIAACGGFPLAAVNVVSAANDIILRRIMEGVAEGCRKFGVFMSGGHTHPGASHNSLSVAILGTASPDRLVFSHTARPGDHIIFALELEGNRRTRFGWNSTFQMTPAHVKECLAIPGDLASKGVISACKDISNPGCLGTAAMLLESSGMGARIRLDEIPHPPGETVPFRDWLNLYQGCGFVLTAAPEDATKVCRKFERLGMASAVCGVLDETRRLIIERESEGAVLVVDLEKDPVTGIGSRTRDEENGKR